MITTINEFRKINESTDGSTIEYSVRYEKEVDGEFDNFTENFTEDELDKAIEFATMHYRPIDVTKTLSNGKILSGYVDTTTKEVVMY